MTAKSKKKYSGSYAFDGKLTRAMPEDTATHSSLTLDEIKTFPVVEWNESKKQWEYQELDNGGK